jgi:hypothetical protein
MYIPHIFHTDPLAGAAVLFCLATICWYMRVIRRWQWGTDRFLLGLLGLIAICQVLRIFENLGAWTASEPFRRPDDFVNLRTGGLCLIGALLLEISGRDRISAEVGLRPVRMNPGKQSDSLHKLRVPCRFLLATVALLAVIRLLKAPWAIGSARLLASLTSFWIQHHDPAFSELYLPG